MNKTKQSKKIILSASSLYAILVISSLAVIGSGVFVSNAPAQNTTGENATGTEFMGSTVNTTNATSSPQASMGDVWCH